MKTIKHYNNPSPAPKPDEVKLHTYNFGDDTHYFIKQVPDITFIVNRQWFDQHIQETQGVSAVEFLKEYTMDDTMSILDLAADAGELKWLSNTDRNHPLHAPNVQRDLKRISVRNEPHRMLKTQIDVADVGKIIEWYEIKKYVDLYYEEGRREIHLYYAILDGVDSVDNEAVSIFKITLTDSGMRVLISIDDINLEEETLRVHELQFVPMSDLTDDEINQILTYGDIKF